MDTPGGRDEHVQQQERLQREEAYYHFINGLNEEEYRLMRDSNLLGTPGEVTAEELRQRLDGAKERLLAQPHLEPRPQSSESHEDNGGRGGVEAGSEASNGDSLLEWLNTFRRTGNATRSGQSGNQTWRAVSRTNPNSGEFRFSLEININHEQPEPSDATDSPSREPPPLDPAHPSQGRRPQVRRTRSGSAAAAATAPPTPPLIPAGRVTGVRRGGDPGAPAQAAPPQVAAMGGGRRGQAQGAEHERGPVERDCPRAAPEAGQSGSSVAGERRSSRTRARGRRGCRGGRGMASRRSRSPLHRPADNSQPTEPSSARPDRPNTPEPAEASAAQSIGLSAALTQVPGESEGSMDVGDTVSEPGSIAPVLPLPGTAQDTSTPPPPGTDPETPDQPPPGPAPDTPAPPPPGAASEGAGAGEEAEAQAAGQGGAGVRRHPTIMLDLQVRRIRPGENRDRDSIASRTRSRVRTAENTVTFESDSGGFRRTISRSERAGIRTYVSTIRIPLRRISETGLGEPSSTALRSILRQIMTGFGELSSLMETEADAQAAPPAPEPGPGPQAHVARGDEDAAPPEPPERQAAPAAGAAGERLAAGEDERAGAGGAPGEGRAASRDTNNLVENGTLPILRLAHFFLLNDDEDEEHQRGLTKEQIDNLSTRTYGQASLEGELGRACSVCINEYAQGNKLRRLPCAHEFHIHCIDRWLSENNTCPICRQPVLSAPQE
ncbi:E3 ubiquitin-protein ligase RNF6-like [Anguilla anguilla]|uniref:E3 ubiquitin-protein ligase RNF6-like n=1 Tax=Anguilla anguilla TaxID=7936 RepID=UPI0015ACEA57|nr:E3 ubiquitin-protein ligase RNF6-like [Anguilla anguilla]